MYICPTCNTTEELITAKGRLRRCAKGHKLWQVESVAKNVIEGISIALLVAFSMGLVVTIVVPPEWKMLASAIVSLLMLFGGIAGVIEAWKFSKMKEPARSLSKQCYVSSLSFLLTILLLFAIAAFRVLALR